MNLHQEIIRQVGALGGVAKSFTPMSCYNADGDCIEFHLSNECFFARRLDGWFTVYIGEDSGEVVGGVIKGVKASLLRRFPGIKIDVDGNKVSVAVLLRAAAYQSSDEIKQRAYKDIISKAEKNKLTTDLEPICT